MQLENAKLTEEQIAGLKKLREPFPPEQISKLPKPTAAQTAEVKKNFKAGMRCNVCGGWHHPKVVHLDYVGHAALTSRLLDADLLWDWEPFAIEEDGSPKLDQHGGMWIWLTVCGMKRRGYGDSDGKSGSNANKERIGDALRNAAMRFGAALDLWSKADLTKIDGATDGESLPEEEEIKGPANNPQKIAVLSKWLSDNVDKGCTVAQLERAFGAAIHNKKAEFSAEDYDELFSLYNDLKKEIQQKGSK